MKPLVSILTASYNSEKYIDTYVEKLISMTYPNVEIVFVDDGSKDKTKEILFANKKKIENKGYTLKYFYQENSGQAAALNVAVKNMTGMYFTILDVDDFLFANCLDMRIEVLEENNEIGFVVSNGNNYTYPDLDNKKSQIFEGIDEKNFFEKVLQGYYVCNLAYTFRTAIFEKYNPERSISTLRAGQNLQVILPYALHSKMSYLSTPLFGRVNHTDSHSQNAARGSFEYKIHRENEIIQIITETMYKDCEGAMWLPSVYMKSLFTKCLISIAEGNKNERVQYKRQAVKMYVSISKQFFKGLLILLKAKVKIYIKKITK